MSGRLHYCRAVLIRGNAMRVIGITGGVGAGKSTVLDYLEKECGACVIQADKVGHMVMEPEGSCYWPIIELFGEKILDSNKNIDRKAVSDVVFKDKAMLEKLNGLVHPAVKEYILKSLETEREAGRTLFVVEAALLFEDHYEVFCDEVWYIHTDMEIRIERLQSSRGYTREKAISIIQNQASDDYFREKADCVIENNGNPEETYAHIAKEVKRNEIL